MSRWPLALARFLRRITRHQPGSRHPRRQLLARDPASPRAGLLEREVLVPPLPAAPDLRGPLPGSESVDGASKDAGRLRISATPKELGLDGVRRPVRSRGA